MAITTDGYCYAWGCADGGWTGLSLPKDLCVVDPGPANDRCAVALTNYIPHRSARTLHVCVNGRTPASYIGSRPPPSRPSCFYANGCTCFYFVLLLRTALVYSNSFTRRFVEPMISLRYSAQPCGLPSLPLKNVKQVATSAVDVLM